MATAYITYHQNVGPNQVQAPQGHISDATLAISGSHADTTAVTASCLAEISTDTLMNITYGPSAVATTSIGQRLPAGAFGYFIWLNAGDRISVIASAA